MYKIKNILKPKGKEGRREKKIGKQEKKQKERRIISRKLYF